MPDRLLIPLPGIGTLALTEEQYRSALEDGARLNAAPPPQGSAPDEPLLEAETEGGGDRAVNDRNHAWRPAQENRFNKRAVDRRFEARAVLAS